jgi:hypothetical protein
MEWRELDDQELGQGEITSHVGRYLLALNFGAPFPSGKNSGVDSIPPVSKPSTSPRSTKNGGPSVGVADALFRCR